MRTIELTCDPASDRAVRTVWRQLADGGVDSLADNPHPGHRPHLTLAVCGAIAPDRLAAVGELLAGVLPLEVRLSGLLSFGARSRRRVLAWGVVPGPALIELHREVWRLLADAPEPNPLYLPGRWMPHLGLTRRVEPDGLALAHRLLGRHPDLAGAFDAARSFDTESQLTDPLGI
ncbi:2'-5' RNA ligase family protein [Kitasatospora sp. NA04385]|uniref:2'-5' RNA ligase family protein n=1 Tax=Kitasatospora sp. NA04385 TaxID=2742135 RepID=UPI0015922A9D|nr:2'-5' RNA ligase family protein [Kitasatospora sp. NA04385]QKW23844.1 2'-5' RNA ligase family protein [Kitasatospora sp. NA04385]